MHSLGKNRSDMIPSSESFQEKRWITSEGLSSSLQERGGCLSISDANSCGGMRQQTEISWKERWKNAAELIPSPVLSAQEGRGIRSFSPDGCHRQLPSAEDSNKDLPLHPFSEQGPRPYYTGFDDDGLSAQEAEYTLLDQQPADMSAGSHPAWRGLG